MAVWSEVQLSDFGGAMRLDAEYYQPSYLEFELLTSGSADHLENLVEDIIHPVEIKREYVDYGIQILLAQNIRKNYLLFDTTVYMPESMRSVLAKNRLHFCDVVITRSGVNFGDTACYLGEPPEIFACADCLIIRPREIPCGYLATFFNTSIGRGLLRRGAYGAAQPHVAPSYLHELRIPRLGQIEQEVHYLITAAYDKKQEARTYYQRAEYTLLSELGLEDIGRWRCSTSGLSRRCERPGASTRSSFRLSIILYWIIYKKSSVFFILGKNQRF